MASFLPLQVHSGGFYGGSSSIDPNHLISSLIAVSFGWSSMVERGRIRSLVLDLDLDTYFISY